MSARSATTANSYRYIMCKSVCVCVSVSVNTHKFLVCQPRNKFVSHTLYTSVYTSSVWLYGSKKHASISIHNEYHTNEWMWLKMRHFFSILDEMTRLTLDTHLYSCSFYLMCWCWCTTLPLTVLYVLVICGVHGKQFVVVGF